MPFGRAVLPVVVALTQALNTVPNVPIFPPVRKAAVTFPSTPAAWQALMHTLPTYGDGDLSVKLDANRVAILTGDAVPRSTDHGGDWAHNTITVVNGTSAHVVAGGDPTANGALPYQMIPNDPDGGYHWLGPAFVADGLMYALAPHNQQPDGTSNFVTTGSDWAVFDVRSEPRFLGTSNWQTFTGTQQVNWTAGVWYDSAAKLVYVFGVSAAPTDGWTGHNAYLARVPIASIMVKSSVTYWAGVHNWTSDVSAAQPIFTAPSGQGVDTAFSAWYDGVQGTWNMTCRLGGRFGSPTLTRYSTTALGGTWTQTNLATFSNDAYLGWEHVNLPLLPDGKRLATFNIAGSETTWIEVAK